MPTIEEMNAAIDEASRKAAEAMLEKNPAAVEVLAGFRLLKARVGEGGDFGFSASIDTRSDWVTIKTTLPTDYGDKLSLVVYPSGLINVNYGDRPAGYPVSDKPPAEQVLDALALVTEQLTNLGQLAPPPVASPKPRMLMSSLANRLVEEFRCMRAESGGVFDFNALGVDDHGDTRLVAVFNTASGSARVDILVNAAKGTIVLDAEEEVGSASGGWKPEEGVIVRKAATLVDQRLMDKIEAKTPAARRLDDVGFR